MARVYELRFDGWSKALCIVGDADPFWMLDAGAYEELADIVAVVVMCIIVKSYL